MIKLIDLLKEAKQVGTVYHYTTFKGGLGILKSNQLKSAETADSTKTNPIYAVSFTRNKRFHNNHNIGFDVSSFGQTPQIRFTVDGDKLSNKYKIQPYAQIGGAGRFEKQHVEFEAEERVVSNKPFTIPILPYIKSIDILVEYKKPSKYSDGEYDFDEEYNYREYAPLRAEIIKLAQDENLTVNLIINKNCNIGIIAFSQKIQNKNKKNLYYWDIPKYLYPKIKQELILIKNDKKNLSKKIFKYIKKNKTKNIIKKNGYNLK